MRLHGLSFRLFGYLVISWVVGYYGWLFVGGYLFVAVYDCYAGLVGVLDFVVRWLLWCGGCLFPSVGCLSCRWLFIGCVLLAVC